MSEFPDWMGEDYFGLWFSPSYKQAQAIHRAYEQIDRGVQGVILDESMEFTPEAWDYLVKRMREHAE